MNSLITLHATFAILTAFFIAMLAVLAYTFDNNPFLNTCVFLFVGTLAVACFFDYKAKWNLLTEEDN